MLFPFVKDFIVVKNEGWEMLFPFVKDFIVVKNEG